ncbi:hypothetical protein BT63DRAFT_232764 [Microthyrium microscopicum]|uniref:F-box domain-containing protein n=1 Tax=Microthyrium microscopicum TaxID=703497 RepID=A0A6A6UDA1_9PEZI|nr:hypothetical protein BT63DRAFT_232764 [Microthyrium microscopicum]
MGSPFSVKPNRLPLECMGSPNFAKAVSKLKRLVLDIYSDEDYDFVPKRILPLVKNLEALKLSYTATTDCWTFPDANESFKSLQTGGIGFLRELHLKKLNTTKDGILSLLESCSSTLRALTLHFVNVTMQRPGNYRTLLHLIASRLPHLREFVLRDLCDNTSIFFDGLLENSDNITQLPPFDFTLIISPRADFQGIEGEKCIVGVMYEGTEASNALRHLSSSTVSWSDISTIELADNFYKALKDWDISKALDNEYW